MRIFTLLLSVVGGFFMAGIVDVGVLTSEANAQDGGGDRVTGAPFATRSVVLGTNGMVATSHPLASQIAIDILKAGGNAVDAAIAANAALGLMEPTGNGIGGDLFAIVWDPTTKKLHGLNASGRSPINQPLAGLKAKLPEGATAMNNFGSLSVTIPGAVDGWFELHSKFGSLEMSQILAPTVNYAREGFPVTQVVSRYMADYKKTYEEYYATGEIEETQNYKDTYFIDGDTPKEGQIFKNPDLGDTLEAIGENGRDEFYKGDTARTMANYMESIGGPFVYEDFANHRSEWVEPQSVNYRGYDVWELPPNGQGIAALQLLNILEGYDLKSMGHNSAPYLHRMAEATKLVFEDRARFYADPDYYTVDVDFLLSKSYAGVRRDLIKPDQANLEVDHGDPKLIEGDTIYMTVADKNGMMVSLIQSNYRGMGSGLVPDGLGFIFQDRGALFSLDENHPNAYAPNKRPFHTIIPAFMTKDGEPIMSFGLMGGGIQPQGHAQIVVNMIDFGMNLQEAGDVARWYQVGTSEPFIVGGKMTDGGTLLIESGISINTVKELEKLGHNVRYTTGPFGGYQAIWRDPKTGVYYGASEMRKDGMAIGY